MALRDRVRPRGGPATVIASPPKGMSAAKPVAEPVAPAKPPEKVPAAKPATSAKPPEQTIVPAKPETPVVPATPEEPPVLDPRAVRASPYRGGNLPEVPLRLEEVPEGVVVSRGVLCYRHDPFDGSPRLALRTPRGFFAWRYDWPVSTDVVSCQVLTRPGTPPRAVWLGLRPDRVAESRRAVEVQATAYRIWERGRNDLVEFVEALRDADARA